MKTKGSGILQKKILTCLLAGLSMSLSRSPRHHWRILFDELPKELAKINLTKFEYGLHRLFNEKYIDVRKENGSYTVHLTAKGRQASQFLNLDAIIVPRPQSWDKKWRLVVFDIPEIRRKQRDILRFHMKRIGLKEIQKSVFCFPYDCGRQIIELVRALSIDQYVKYIVAEEVSDDSALIKHFDLA